MFKSTIKANLIVPFDIRANTMIRFINSDAKTVIQ